MDQVLMELLFEHILFLIVLDLENFLCSYLVWVLGWEEGYPSGCAPGKSLGLRPYFTVYPYLSPNTNIITFLTREHTVPNKVIYGAVCSLGNIWCKQREHTVPNKGAYGTEKISLALTGQLHVSWKIFLTL